MPRVLILIVTYNSARYIQDCLSSVYHDASLPDSPDVLVVDNGSTDDSVTLIRNGWPQVRIIENRQNLGFAGGNNVGLRYAIENGFDYVYLLNADTEVEPGFLGEAIQLAERDPRTGAVQSKLLLFEDKGIINTTGNRIHYTGIGFAGEYGRRDHDIKASDIAFASGASVLLRVSAIRDVGLFNERFFLYLEDADLCWRLRLRGYRVMVSPRSVVYHKYEFSRNTDKFYYLERNRFLMLLHNYRLATLLVLLLPISALQLCILLYSLLTGWWREELRTAAYFLRARNWKMLFATRRQIQRSRRVADREILKGFATRIEFRDLANPVLTYGANPMLSAYWFIAKRVICW